MPQPGNLLNTIRVVKGQTKVLHVTVKTCEGKAASLNGATLYFTARESPGATVLISLTSPSNGIDITDAAAGKATVTMSSTDTDLDVGCYYYDLWVEFPGTPPIRHPVVKKAELIIEPSLANFV
jgi:hypothetical protein